MKTGETTGIRQVSTVGACNQGLENSNLNREMDMRHLIAVGALILASSAQALESDDFMLNETADLVALCSTAEDNPAYANAMGFCHGILTGAYRYYLASALPQDRYVCSPNPPPTRQEVMSGFVNWVSAHSEYLGDRPVDALFRYLAETYPCQK